ncbi:hypothetical protein PVAR5_3283 [Paecilomyces variotii No. 5]|uniref:Uncharacterized protein n=1 Tax=Byssochlamys spectabilis (strain No. 5 / NBRC 109023) TaxID=1356009 RepID=V5FCG5_BYSSN|nr:hypothetical protein PVAR5_3283 [Paecilomyces variotii No. 5]
MTGGGFFWSNLDPKRHEGRVPRLWSRGGAIDVDAQGSTRWIEGVLVAFRAPLRARAESLRASKGGVGGQQPLISSQCPAPRRAAPSPVSGRGEERTSYQKTAATVVWDVGEMLRERIICELLSTRSPEWEGISPEKTPLQTLWYGPAVERNSQDRQ